MLLRGRTLGIIGVGNIGKETARRAIAFGLHVIGNDIRSISTEFLRETGMEMCEKDSLLSRSDFVVISCDLNSTSRHLIDADALNKVKRSSFLINVARGQIVDTRALAEALREGKIAGAALDVFEDEPLPPDSPLRLFDNCILGAHNAYNADRTVDFVHRNTLNNLLKHLRRKKTGSIEEALEEAFHDHEFTASGADHVL